MKISRIYAGSLAGALGCVLLVAFSPPIQGSYACSFATPHIVPAVQGKRYSLARQAVLQQGWQPLTQECWKRWPEQESCSRDLPKRCEFIFHDNSGYQLVIVTRQLPGETIPKVERHYFRCRL